MNKIFLVLKNLKHNGELLAVGSLFEGLLADFQWLCDQGVLKVVEGATSLEDAAKVVEGDVAILKERARTDALKANNQVDKWAPKKEAEPAPEVVPPVPAPEVIPPAPAPVTPPAAASEQAPAVAPAVGKGDVAPAPVDKGTDL